MDTANTTFAVIGGTGALGGGLVHRMAHKGLDVIVGSRSREKAEDFAATVASQLPGARIAAASNEEAAARADVVIVAVPFGSQVETLDAIRAGVQGKTVIDTSVCLQPPKVGTVQIPPGGSACVQSQAQLGGNVRVVAAFQNISAEHLQDLAYDACDVLVCGDDEAARSVAVSLCEALGLRGLHAGPLANATAVEGMTSVLITLNRKYRIAGGAGIRITGHA